MIAPFQAIPAPSGGAVKLILGHVGDLAALILATNAPTPPDSVTRAGARVVHQGRVRLRENSNPHAPRFYVMDLNTDALPDGEVVYYHAFEQLPDGTHRPAVTVSCTPRCLRQAVVLLMRDLVKPRLRYHLTRGIHEGALTDWFQGNPVQVFEQEVRAQGVPLPAIFIKETATPAPDAETIGKAGGEYLELDGTATREYRHAFNTRVDVLLLCGNAVDRAQLEQYVEGALLQDLDYYQHGGIENPQVSRFPRHDLDDGGAEYYTCEFTLQGTTYARVVETLTWGVTDNRSEGRHQ